MAEVLTQHNERWPDKKTGPLEVSVTVAIVNGRPEAIGVEIWGVHPAALSTKLTGMTPKAARERWRLIASDAETPLRTVDLRIPLGRIVEEATASASRTARVLTSKHVRESSAWAGRPAVQREAERIRAAIDGDTGPKRRGRRPHPRSHYEEVADVYSQALALGQDPTQAVADHFVVVKSQAAKWVYRCRREPLNLLPPTTRGRPSRAVLPPPPK